MTNFELKICNFGDAFALGFGWADRVISLIDQDAITRPDFSTAIPHHIEVFDDCISKEEEDRGAILPSTEHIERILEFTKSIQDREKVLIHCHGGVSRSTAVAILVLIQHGRSPASALSEVLQIRACAWPNELIIAIGDTLLNCDGMLIKFIKTWMESNAGKLIF